MAITDVTIYGAGIFGLSIGWACLKRGARVQIIDPNGPGGGASGGIVGALAPHVPDMWNDKKQFQYESLIMAPEFWRDVDQVSGLASGYNRSGRIQPLVDARAVEFARLRIDGARDLWHGKAEWQVLERDPAPGWAPDSPTGFWVFDSLSARMSPRHAAASLAAAIQARGGRIETDAAAKGAVIWATGVAGLAELSGVFGKPVGSAVKGQSALLDLDMRDQPQLFADGVHIIPHDDGTCAVGSTSERDFDSPDNTDFRLDDVLEKARALSPALRDAPVLERWAGLRPRAKSRSPILGGWPGRPGHFIANGGFKIGFGMAPKVAETMADLVLEGRDQIPDGFRVTACL